NPRGGRISGDRRGGDGQRRDRGGARAPSGRRAARRPAARQVRVRRVRRASRQRHLTRRRARLEQGRMRLREEDRGMRGMWLRPEGRALRRGDRQTVGVTSQTETERLQPELRPQYEAVRAERDFLITISRATPSLLAILDRDGRVNSELGVNKAFRAIIGFGDEDAVGRFFWELVARPEEMAQLRVAVLEEIETDTLVEHESTWLTRAGAQLAVTWTCRQLGVVGEHPLFLVCATDVTEHRFREALLQRERNITATLMQAIPSLVVVVDSDAVIVDSGVDETTAGVNDAFRTALGWPHEQLVHRSVLDLIDDEDGSYLALMAIASAANGVASTERESQWLRADGGRIDVAWTATPVADVTGRKDSLVLITG